MNKAILLIVFAAVAVAVFNPLGGWVEARFGAGFGDLVNGGAAMGLMLLAGLAAVVILVQRKRAGGVK